MTETTPAEKAYAQLFEKVSALYAAAGESQLTAYWKTGRYLEEIKKAFPRLAVHGQNFIEKLSQDLTKQYGKGFSTTTLKDMRTLYREYPKSLPADFLDWTKIILLLRIQDREAREELIQKALDEDLTRTELQSLIDLYRLKNTGAGLEEKEFIAERGILFHYKRVNIKESQKSVTVDCGFNVWRTVEIENASTLRDKTFFSTEKREGKYVINEVLEDSAEVKNRFFTYRAEVEKVIDGDTLWLLVDTGFGTTVRQKIRLRGVDTPEIEFDEGIKAKNFVQRQLKDCLSIIVKTYKTDKYDRYIADIFYLQNEDNVEKICREGILLNSEIISRGYGRRI